MKLDEKKTIVADLQDRFTRSKLAIVVDYQGLDVQAITDLRRQLRDAGVEFQVVKNTLLRRAAADTAVNNLAEFFIGPSAVALSFDDPVAPAKVLTEFAKKNEKLEIKAGIMDAKTLDPNAIKALSNLPSREELLAQVLSAMNAVPTGLVRVLNAVPQNFMNVLQAIKEQKEQQEAA